MAFLDFVANAIQGAGHEVGQAVGSSPVYTAAKGAIGGLGIDVKSATQALAKNPGFQAAVKTQPYLQPRAVANLAQQIPRGGFALGATVPQALGLHTPTTFTPNAPVSRAIFGTEPIKTYRGAVAQNAPKLEQNLHLPPSLAKGVAGAGFALGTIGQAGLPEGDAPAIANEFAPKAMQPELANPDLRLAADSAVHNMAAIRQRITTITNTTADWLQRKGFTSANPQETALLHDSLEHPESLATNAAASKNPALHQQAVALVRGNLAKVNAIRQAVGFKNQLPNYLPHDYQVTDPQAAEAALQKLGLSPSDAQNYIAGSNKQRLFQDLRQAHAVTDEQGNQLFVQNPDTSQVMRNYGADQAKQAGNQTLVETLHNLAPGHVGTGIDRGPDGRIMQTLDIPGLANTFSHQLLQQPQLKNLEPGTLANTPVGKSLDLVSQSLKRTVLALSEFHPIKETLNMAGNSLNSPQDTIPGLYKGLAAFASRDFAHSLEQASYEARSFPRFQGSVNDALAHMDVTVGSANPEAATIGKIPVVGKAVTANEDATFGRMIRAYKTASVEAWLKSGGDPTSPEGRQVGAQINNIFGGQNNLVKGTNKEVQFLGRQALLASDFTTGKVKNLVAAARGIIPTLANSGDAYARNNLIGTVLTTAITTELAKRLTTGQFDPSLVAIIKNAILDPNVPLPPAFNTPGDARTRVAKVPGSNVTEVARAVADPLHYAEARLASPISLATRALTNTDYYGRQISNPTDSLAKKALNLAQTTLPIGVTQALQALEGKVSLPTAALQTAGIRTNLNPSDPSVVIAQGRQQYASTLPQNLAEAYSALHPTTKDAEGNALAQEGPLGTQQNALIYLNHPEFLAADTALMRHAGGAVDPFWTQTPEVQHQILLSRSAGVVSAADKATISRTPSYRNYVQQANAFYQAHPSANPSALQQSATQLQTTNPNLSDAQANVEAKRQALGLSNTPSGGRTSTSLKGPSLKGITLTGVKSRRSGGATQLRTLKPFHAPKAKAVHAPRLKAVKPLKVPRAKPLKVRVK